MSFGWAIKCWTWRRLNVLGCRPRRVFHGDAEIIYKLCRMVNLGDDFAKQKDWIVLGRLRLRLAVINSDDLSSFPSRFRVPSRKTSAKQVAAVFSAAAGCGRSKSKESEKRRRNAMCCMGWLADAQTFEISQIKKLTFKGMLMLCQ